MDGFLARVFDNYKGGLASRDRVVGIISHVMTAAAADNQKEFKAYLRVPKSELLDD